MPRTAPLRIAARSFSPIAATLFCRSCATRSFEFWLAPLGPSHFFFLEAIRKAKPGHSIYRSYRNNTEFFFLLGDFHFSKEDIFFRTKDTSSIVMCLPRSHDMPLIFRCLTHILYILLDFPDHLSNGSRPRERR